MEFTQITETTFISQDWAYVIEKTRDGWTVSEHGEWAATLNTKREAISFTDDFSKGLVLRGGIRAS